MKKMNGIPSCRVVKHVKRDTATSVLENMKVTMNEVSGLYVERQFRDCEEATIHQNESHLEASYKRQKGWRSINSSCNSHQNQGAKGR